MAGEFPSASRLAPSSLVEPSSIFLERLRFVLNVVEDVNERDRSAIPRHNEISDMLARKICHDLGYVGRQACE